MAKVQAVWAIDIGQVALKALKVVPGDTPDQMVVEEIARIEYPKILSQPDADPDELVRMALIEFLEKHSTKGCRIAIGVPGQKGLIKFIKLPPVEKKRIPEIVQYEAKQQIPFPLNEVVWDYQQLASEDDDDSGDDDEMSFTMAEVGLFAMKREEINKALFPLRRLGLEPDIVQMTPIALYNFATFERQDRMCDYRRQPDLAEKCADRREPLHTGPDQRDETGFRQGGSHQARRRDLSRHEGGFHGDEGRFQGFLDRNPADNRVLWKCQQGFQGQEDHWPGQWLQAPRPDHLPAAGT